MYRRVAPMLAVVVCSSGRIWRGPGRHLERGPTTQHDSFKLAWILPRRFSHLLQPPSPPAPPSNLWPQPTFFVPLPRPPSRSFYQARLLTPKHSLRGFVFFPLPCSSLHTHNCTFYHHFSRLVTLDAHPPPRPSDLRNLLRRPLDALLRPASPAISRLVPVCRPPTCHRVLHPPPPARTRVEGEVMAAALLEVTGTSCISP